MSGFRNPETPLGPEPGHRAAGAVFPRFHRVARDLAAGASIAMVRPVINRGFSGVVMLGIMGAAAACGSSGTESEPDTAASSETVGSLGLQLQTASGATLSSFKYVITGPGGFSRTDGVNIAGSRNLTALIGDLPVGSGFTVALTASTADGSLACTGSAGFNVLARATSVVSVHLQCREVPRTGGVVVNGDLNVCPAIDGLGASPAAVSVGNQLTLSATAHDSDAMPKALTYGWAVSSGTLSDATAREPKLTCTVAGDIVVTLDVTDGDCSDTQTATVTCGDTTPSGTPRVVINEVESNGGVPGDWVELYNAGTAAADISGWKFKDNDDTHTFYVIPAGTTLLPGAYYVLEEAQFGFGLGGADSARLYDALGTSVDSFSWTAHAALTYGRCASGSGPLGATTSTKAAANDCGTGTGGSSGSSSGGTGGAAGMGGASGGAGGPSGGSAGAGGTAGGGASLQAWPGTDAVVTVDEANYFGTNLSGLNYQPVVPGTGAAAVLWAVQNSPSKLFRLLFNGVSWVPDAENGWASGKLLHYATGTGAPDTEGVTKADWAGSSVYVSTERDNNNNSVSRLSILRFDSSGLAGELTALNDWNLTADLPVVGANLGLEAITFVPDAALLAGGFFDEATHAKYDPAVYPNHGGGLFFVGVEGNGFIYAYALDHATSGFVRVATFFSGQSGVMDLAYDREHDYLWGYHDNGFANKASVFRLDTAALSPTAGRFQVSRSFEHPSTLPNVNNEGITFAPDAECVAGQKSFFWSDDDATAGHAIRRGTIPCGAFL
jgi:hypothetical protein